MPVRTVKMGQDRLRVVQRSRATCSPTACAPLMICLSGIRLCRCSLITATLPTHAKPIRPRMHACHSDLRCLIYSFADACNASSPPACTCSILDKSDSDQRTSQKAHLHLCSLVTVEGMYAKH